MAASYTSPDSAANDITTRVEMITSRMDEIIEKELLTGAMTPDSALIQATGRAGEVKLATIDCSGLGNYDKQKGYQFGSVNLEWNDYKLAHDRGVVLDIDRLEQDQTGGLASTGALAARLVRGYINPEIDATRISGVYAAINGDTTLKTTNLATETLTAAGVLSAIEKGIDQIAEVWPQNSGYTIYISTAVKTLLRSSSEYTKVKDISAGSGRLSTDVTEIDGNDVVWVPQFRMKTAYTYQDIDSTSSTDGGIAPTSAAQDINFLIVAPGVANGLVTVNAEKYITKEFNQRKDADSLYVRVYHDVIVPKNAAVGAYVSVAPSSARGPSDVTQDLESASAYSYTDYEYTGTMNVSGSNVTVAYDSSVMESSSAIMYDFARYLGALYRECGVTKVGWNGTTYTWDTEGTLKGSNYKDSNGTTLVSAVTAWYQANMADQTSGSIELVLTYGDGYTVTVTYAVTIATASLSATPTTTTMAATASTLSATGTTTTKTTKTKTTKRT